MLNHTLIFLVFGFFCLHGWSQPERFLCDHPDIRQDFSEGEKRYHHYLVQHEIGDTSNLGMNPEAVFETLLSDKQLLAPCKRSVKGPLESCSEMPVIIGPFRNESILAAVDRESLRVINYSLPGHWLYPGYVIRTLELKDGVYVMTTESEGTGHMPRMNERLANRVWGKMARKARRALE